jgi:hypothetical protein
LKKNLDLPQVMKAQDIQAFLNISRGKAYGLFKEEGFPALNIGGSKRVYKEDFLKWVDKQKKTS